MSSIVLEQAPVATQAAAEAERVVAIVTGANGGVGVGLCERLLELYSLPAGHVIREALPQTTALLPGLASTGARETVLSGPPLTLILAVRNTAAGEETRAHLLASLRKTLVYRSRHEGLGSNQSAKWLDALKIVVERVDFETPHGEYGVLAFTERIGKQYPYVTSVYANAGLMAVSYVSWLHVLPEILRVGVFRTFAFPDKYQVEQKGRMTRDGQRGAVWSINTLAPYILIKELSPLLARSPRSLNIPPRFVYTSSSTAELERFDGLDITDAQMTRYDKTYSTSKYAANAVITELDSQIASASGANANDHTAEHEENSGRRRTRCLLAEPAIVQTSVGSANFAGLWVLGTLIEAFQWLTFVLCRLCGSPYHVKDGRDAATAILYASLVPDRYLPPAPSSPSPTSDGSEARWRFALRAHPMSEATVELQEQDRWSDPRAQEIAKVQMKECEAVWRMARFREGLDEKAPGGTQ